MQSEGGKARLAKIIIMGDYAVGKTSLAKRIVGEEFSPLYDKTIGVDFRIRKFPINVEEEEIPVKWVLWDLAGHWEFSEITSDFFQGAKAGLFVFDIPRPKTLESLWVWGERLKQEMEKAIPVTLVGNKKDWRGKANTCVSRETAENYTKKLESLLETDFEIPYIETSAKNDEHVMEAFQTLIKLYKETEGLPSA